MRSNLFLTFLILLALVDGCRQDPFTAIPPDLATIQIHPLSVPTIDSPTTNVVRESMSLFLYANPYAEYGNGRQLMYHLISSGEFDRTDITLDDGSIIQADLLYAYTLMSNQRVVVVPVVVGITLPDGHYAYFSEKFAFETMGGVMTTETDRETALADSYQRLPRGRVFRLISYGMVSRQEQLWDQCLEASFMPAAACQVGEIIEKYHPGDTKLFILRTADHFPSDWFLIGWVFQEFAPEELAPGINIDVPIPASTLP